MNILVHTSFIGTTGYNNHARSFFTALNKYHTIKVRNLTIGDTWKGMSNNPHDNEYYFTPEIKNMLILQTLFNNDGTRSDYPMYDYKGDFKPDVHIILNESDNFYFYENYDGYKIGFCVYESTRFPENFYKRLHYFDEMWVPTQWQFDSLVQQGYPLKKIKIVTEGVDINTFKPCENIPSKDKFRFLLFGRWDYRKSTTEIIRTFGETFKGNNNVELICSVENPYPSDGLNSTEERIKYHNLEYDNIKYLKFPSRGEYVKYLQEGDVFVSCARSEGWNLPLCEAMSCGTPSIYSDYGGQLQFASNKGIPVKVSHIRQANITSRDVDGEYCEPDFDDLKNKMLDVYQNYDEYKKKAVTESKLIHEEFNWDNVAKNASNILNKININKSFTTYKGTTYMTNLLDQLAKEHKSDKSSEFHNYCVKYEKYLPFNRDDKLKILEIGVEFGNSMRMWRDYFFISDIIGIDIVPDCVKHNSKRITVEIGDQTDENFLNSVSDKHGPFDMIVDDGSHICQHITRTFNVLFPSLKSGGVYIIEDTHASYYEDFGGGYLREDSTIEYFKDLIDNVNFRGIGQYRNDKYSVDLFKEKYPHKRTDIESISFLNGLILIVKK